MNFHEKLRRRVSELGLNKAKASRDAGLPESTISSYLSDAESIPRLDTALKVARAIDVPLDWLADDSQDWPPPRRLPDAGASEFSDQQLLHELARRLWLLSLDLLDEAAIARTIDWGAVADEAGGVGADAPIPESVRRALRLFASLQLKLNRVLQDFDVKFYSVIHYMELPGGGRRFAEIVRVMHGAILSDIETIPHIMRFGETMRDRPEWRESEARQILDFYENRGRFFHGARPLEGAPHPPKSAKKRPTKVRDIE